MAPTLQAAGHDVVGLDTYFVEDCTFGANGHDISSLRKDIRDVKLSDLDGFDAVAHLAALCNDPLGDLNPQLTQDINYTASIQLAKLAKEAGVERFLYASSCSLYGAASSEDILTEESAFCPLTAYALSKARTEEDLALLADDDFSPVYMRSATAYGASPRLRADVVLNNLTCWAYTTGKVRIVSDGSPWRPIVHVEDIARAFAAALVAPRAAIHNQAFNVGLNDENYQVREIAEIVQETVPGCEVEYAGQGGPDPRNYRVNFDKITETLVDFKPKWNARRGAQELYSALKMVGLTLNDFEDRKYIRLKQFNHLLNGGYVDSALRWSKALNTL